MREPVNKNPSDDPFNFNSFDDFDDDDSFDWDQRDDKDQYSPRQRNRDGSPPPARRKRAKKSNATMWVLGILGGMGLSIVLCCGGAVWWVRNEVDKVEERVRNDFELTEVDSDGEELADTVEEIQELIDSRIETDAPFINEAFSSKHVGVPEDKKKEIDEFLTKLVEAINSEELDPFRSLSDTDKNAQTIKESPFFPHSNRFDSVEAITRWQRNIFVINEVGITNHHIAHIALPKDKPLAIVDSFFIAYGKQSVSYRLWMTKKSGAWKLYDWHAIDDKLRYSDHMAALYDIWNNQLGVKSRYKNFINEVDKSDDLSLNGKGDIENQTQEIYAGFSRAEKIQLPVVMKSYQLMALSHRWSELDCYREAFRLMVEAEKYDNPIGIAHLRLRSYAQLKKHEKVLEYAKVYEELAGHSPEVSYAKANAYFALGEPVKAIPEYQYLLTVNPEDVEIMRSLSVASVFSDNTHLVEHLKTLKDPAKSASKVFLQSLYQNNITLLQSLLKFVEQQKPNSPEYLSMQAALHNKKGEYKQAAKLYLQLLKKQKKENQEGGFLSNYLSAMTAADKPIEGYTKVSGQHAQEAFMNFVYQLIEGEGVVLDDKYWEPLAKAHRSKSKDDPWFHYILGYIEADKGEPQKAIQHYQDALKIAEKQKMEKYQISTILSGLIQESANISKEKVVEVYRQYKDHSNIFEQVMNILELNKKVSHYSAVTYERQKTNPDDPMIHYYNVLYWETRGNKEDLIEELLLKAVSNIKKDEAQSWKYRKIYRKLVEVRLKANRSLSEPVELLQNVEYLTVALEQLTLKQDWNKWKDLIDTCGTNHKDKKIRSAILFSVAQKRQLMKQDHLLISLMETVDENEFRPIGEWKRSQLYDWLTSALIRQNQFQKLRQFGEARLKQYNREGMVIAALLVQRKDDELKEFLKLSPSLEYTFSELLNQKEVTSAAGQIMVSDLKKQYPARFERYIPYNTMYLLLKVGTGLSEKSIKEKFNPIPNFPYKVSKFDFSHKSVQKNLHSFLVESDTEKFIISYEQKPYASLANNASIKKNEGIGFVLDGHHSAWLSITLLNTDQKQYNVVNMNAVYKRLGKLTAPFVDKNIIAYGSSGQWINCNQKTDELMTNLKQGATREKLFPHTPYTYLERTEEYQAEQKKITHQQQLARQRIYQQAVEFTKNSSPKDTFQIEVSQQIGDTNIQTWLTVESVIFSGYGTEEYRCKLMKPSPLHSNIKPGSYLTVSNYSITNFKYKKDGKVISGYDETVQAEK